jgi:hypothetical protein
MRFSARARVRIVFAMSCSGLLECGGESERSAPAPYRAPEEPPSEALSTLVSAQCAYIERCDPDAMHLFAGSAKAACEEYFACNAVRGAVPWANGAAPSTIPDACVQSLNSRPCPDLEVEPLQRISGWGTFPWGADCGVPDVEDVVAPEGAPSVGEACIDRHDERERCQGAAHCAEDESPAFGSIYCGTCTALLEVGRTCGNSDRCEAETRCILGQCSEPLQAGEPCTVPEQCRFGTCADGVCGRSKYVPKRYADVLDRACADYDDCGNQVGLTCYEGRCRPLADQGEPCAGHSCRAGQFCVNGRCEQLGCSLDLGEPCDLGCSEGDCREQVCEPAGTRVGDPCRFQCAAGLVCERSRCAAVPDRGTGVPCDFDGDCDSGFCDRDLSAFCSRTGGCSIPHCDKCGTCASVPAAEACE